MTKRDDKPVFLLIHGAWHNPSHFDRLTTLLQDAEYTVHTPKLPSVRSHGQDTGTALEDDTQTLINVMRSLIAAGDNIVVVMHSYAGVPGSDAAAILSEEQKSHHPSSTKDATHGKILALIYLAAFVLDPGVSIARTYNPGGTGAPPSYEVTEEGLRKSTDEATRFYNTTPREVVEEALATLQPTAVSAFVNTARYAGWRDYGIPVRYVGCKLDQAIPPQMQQGFVERIRKAGVKGFEVVWLESDHSPFLHMPDRVAEILRDVAQQKSLK